MISLAAILLFVAGRVDAAEPEPLSGEPFATVEYRDGVPRPAGDVDGDGFDDIVQVGGYEGFVLTIHRGGETYLQPVQRIDIPTWRAWPVRDVNGDGYDDVVTLVDGAEEDSLELLCGSSGGLRGDACATREVSGAACAAQPGGDLDDDGFADVVLIRCDGGVRVLYGDTSGFRTEGTELADSVDDDVLFTDYPVVAADVNGDGFDDLTVATTDNRIVLHLGSSGGLETATADEVGTSLPSGAVLAPAGDVNGDCHADIVVGVSRGQLDSAYVLYGGEEGFGPEILEETQTVLVGTPGTQFGGQVAGAGDVNADGHADVLVGSFGATFVYLGGPEGLSTPPVTTRGDPAWGDDYCLCISAYVSGAGDVDRDGVDDVILQQRGGGDHDLLLGFPTMPQGAAPEACPEPARCGCASTPGSSAAALVGAVVVAVLRRAGTGRRGRRGGMRAACSHFRAC